MTPKEALEIGNEASAQVCHEILESFGPGRDYRLIVASMASNLLFHSFRLALVESKAKAIEILQAIGNDVAHNVREVSGQRISYTVTEEL